MQKKFILIASLILLPVLIFWLGGFHFSKTYLIGRNVPFAKLDTMECDWKNCDAYWITGYDFFDKTICEVKNDTLFLGGKPAAKITNLVHRCFFDYELSLQSFDGTKTGTYISK